MWKQIIKGAAAGTLTAVIIAILVTIVIGFISIDLEQNIFVGILFTLALYAIAPVAGCYIASRTTERAASSGLRIKSVVGGFACWLLLLVLADIVSQTLPATLNGSAVGLIGALMVLVFAILIAASATAYRHQAEEDDNLKVDS